jgi:hypothetical protein
MRDQGGECSYDLHTNRPNGLWALFSRPDRGRPTLHGWWPPVAQRYKGKVGAGARCMRFTAQPVSHQHFLTLTRSREGRCQRREAPPTPATPPRPPLRRRGPHCTDILLHRIDGAGERPQHRRFQRIGYTYSDSPDRGIRWSYSTHPLFLSFSSRGCIRMSRYVLKIMNLLVCT